MCVCCVVCVLLCTLRRSPCTSIFFFLMIRRPPRSTLDRSSAASDVYKRQDLYVPIVREIQERTGAPLGEVPVGDPWTTRLPTPVSYTHLRAHETVLDLVCRLLLEKKKQSQLKALHSLSVLQSRQLYLIEPQQLIQQHTTSITYLTS